MIGTEEAYSQAEVDSVSSKLKKWSQSLSEKERELVELLVNRAQWVGIEGEEIEAQSDVEEAALSALKSFANSKRAMPKDGKHHWKRTTA